MTWEWVAVSRASPQRDQVFVSPEKNLGVLSLDKASDDAGPFSEDADCSVATVTLLETLLYG